MDTMTRPQKIQEYVELAALENVIQGGEFEFDQAITFKHVSPQDLGSEIAAAAAGDLWPDDELKSPERQLADAQALALAARLVDWLADYGYDVAAHYRECAARDLAPLADADPVAAELLATVKHEQAARDAEVAGLRDGIAKLSASVGRLEDAKDAIVDDLAAVRPVLELAASDETCEPGTCLLEVARGLVSRHLPRRPGEVPDGA